MTTIRYRRAPGLPVVRLETAREPLEVVDHIRKFWHPGVDDAAPDPAFREAQRIQREANSTEKEKNRANHRP